MPSANRVPMASELLPEPDTPATATTHHSGMSTSRSRRLLCRTPRASMAVGSRARRSASAVPVVEQPMRVMLCAGPGPTSSWSTEVEMSSRAVGWLDRLRPELDGYARVALDNIGREYPAHVIHLMNEPGDFPFRPRDRNPVFYGSLDWHSCVEMFWLLVRLLKVAPDDVPAGEIRDVFDARLTAEGLQAEAGFIQGGASERPYGWGWALALAAELETGDDPEGRRWAASFRPLSLAITDNFLRWLPSATYRFRTGVHTNSAFAISRALG